VHNLRPTIALVLSPTLANCSQGSLVEEATQGMYRKVSEDFIDQSAVQLIPETGLRPPFWPRRQSQSPRLRLRPTRDNVAVQDGANGYQVPEGTSLRRSSTNTTSIFSRLYGVSCTRARTSRTTTSSLRGGQAGSEIILPSTIFP